MEANIQKTSKAQALVALPSFLKGFARKKNETGSKMESQAEGGIFSRPQTVQKLSQEVRPADKNQFSNRQSPNSLSWTYGDGTGAGNKAWPAICRCGNVHPLEKGLTLWIDAFLPTIRSVVAQYRESHQWPTNLDVVNFITLSSLKGMQ